ncbi:MAG TPA: protein adenylyltransferase SelO family protein, partial [Halioglobus sp.]
GIAHWNLACLGQALLPILHEDEDQSVTLAQNAVNAFPDQFLQANTQGMARKLGLQSIGEQDTALVEALWQLMAQHELDFTLCFRRLADLAHESGGANSVAALFEFPDALHPWLAQWRARLAQDSLSGAQRQATMYFANPVFIPRNHLVEAAIAAATDKSDLSVFNKLVDVLENPHQYRDELALYATPPRPEQVVRQTFCGT